jgi:hypothetical protein
VQPLSSRPKAITLKINANRLNIVCRSHHSDYTISSLAFSSRTAEAYFM